MKYVLYEGGNGDMLFTREEIVNSNKESILAPFENKNPTWTVEADDDASAVALMNSYFTAKAVDK